MLVVAVCDVVKLRSVLQLVLADHVREFQRILGADVPLVRQETRTAAKIDGAYGRLPRVGQELGPEICDLILV